MKQLMVLEWWVDEIEPCSGGWWSVIGFFDTVEDVKAILPSRPADAKIMVLSVEKVEL